MVTSIRILPTHLMDGYFIILDVKHKKNDIDSIRQIIKHGLLYLIRFQIEV